MTITEEGFLYFFLQPGESHRKHGQKHGDNAADDETDQRVTRVPAGLGAVYVGNMNLA